MPSNFSKTVVLSAHSKLFHTTTAWMFNTFALLLIMALPISNGVFCAHSVTIDSSYHWSTVPYIHCSYGLYVPFMDCSIHTLLLWFLPTIYGLFHTYTVAMDTTYHWWTVPYLHCCYGFYLPLMDCSIHTVLLWILPTICGLFHTYTVAMDTTYH